MDNKPNDKKSILMIITSMLIFGSIGIFRRNLPVPSAFLACIRGIIGGIFLIIVVKLKNGFVKVKVSRKQLLLLIISGIVMGLNWIFLFEAYNYTTISIAQLCYYMEPTIVMLLSPIFFRERLTYKKIICIILAVIGMFFVSGVIENRHLDNRSIYGIIFGLLAAVCYSMVVIMNKKVEVVDAYQKTIGQLLTAGIVILPYVIITKSYVNENNNYISIILILVLGIVHTGVAFLLYFGSLHGLSIQSAAILSYIDPVSALLFSTILLKEPMSVYGMIGAVMIIGSAIICEVRV